MVTDPSDAPRPLTDRQRQVLTFVTDEVLRCGVPPTLREIAVYLGVTVNGARDHRDALVRKGALTHDADIARGLRVVTAALPNVEVRDAAGFVVATYRPLPANSRGTDR
jgi:SOS-response transcriptional repressor LexA